MEGDGGLTTSTHHGQRRDGWSWLGRALDCVPNASGSRTKAAAALFLQELKPGEAFRRVRRSAIGTVNYLDRRAGVLAEEPPVVADGPAPVAPRGHAEYAT